MTLSLNKTLAAFFMFTLVACQALPPGTGKSPEAGFRILGHAKPGLRPFVECVAPNRDGSFTAYFGYENTLGKTITLPAGEQNKILENPDKPEQEHDNDDHHNRDQDGHRDRDRNDRQPDYEKDKKQGFSTKSNQSNNSDIRKNAQEDKEKRDRDQEDHKHPDNRRSRQDRGQPTLFLPGRTGAWPNSPLAIVFHQERLTWKLSENKATASIFDSQQRCKLEQINVFQQTAIRKSILPTQTLRITQRNAASHSLSFNLSETADLKRRILVNIINGPNGSSKVSRAQIYVNKQPLNLGINAQTTDGLAQVFTVHTGANTLDIDLNGVSGSAIEIAIEGLMDPIHIPGAMFSNIPDGSVVRSFPHNKRLVGIKFMEGMRVRLQNDTSGNLAFKDLTGISLRSMNDLLKTLAPRLVYPAFEPSPEEQEQEEQKLAAFFGVETINSSLMYQMEFEADQDIWSIVDSLRQLPFIEEAFPSFIPDLASSDPTQPNDQYISGNIQTPEDSNGNSQPTNQWLKNIRVMSDASLGAGSWRYTWGNPNVKVAVLDVGLQHKNLKGVANTHEDFLTASGINPIETLSNLQQDKIPVPYKDLGHGTPAVGVIAAQGNNVSGTNSQGYGTAGIAFNAKTIFVQFQASGIPINCRERLIGGIPSSYSSDKIPKECEPTPEAIGLLLEKHPDTKVIIVEAWQDPGTVELFAPVIRYTFAKLTEQGITVVLPAGNVTCSTKKDADKLKCERFYKEPISPYKPYLGSDISLVLGERFYFDPTNPDPVKSSKYVFTDLTFNRPWADYGTIIVGGLDINGTKRMTGYSHGISKAATLSGSILDKAGTCSNTAGLYTSTSIANEGGHGTDVSGPAEFVWTTAFDDKDKVNKYASFSGTSAASPIVAGVVTQMLSVNPNLKPLEIRRILRCTAQPIAASEHIAGMVNAYEAVKMANGGAPPSPAPTPSGGLSIQSITTTPPANPPSNVSVWITRDGQRKAVNPSQLLGIGLSYPDLNGMTLSIEGQQMPIRSLAQDYVTFGIPADMTPGVKDVLLTLAGSTVTLEEAIDVLAMPPLQQVQSLPTQGGLGLKSFSIGQNLFLAFANFYNGSTHAFQSPIFRWEGNQFQLAQNIPTQAAYDTEAFEIDGQSYLAFTNYGPASNSFTNLYRWNGSQFVIAQQLPTQGGTDSEYFNINGEHYLAIANRDINYTLFNQTSRIYKWNGAQFIEIQGIPTYAAYQWEHQQIGSQHFLTLVSYDSAQGARTANIYQWNGSSFVPFQTLPSNNSLDAEAFQIGSQYFLALSNYDANNASNAETLSWLYRWDGSQFQPFQSFLNKGAHHWRFFNKDGVDYLILANDFGGTKIYRWEGQRFELYRTLVGEGAWAWEFMQVGGQEYLIAVSQYSGPQGFNTPSTVYKFE